MIRGFKITSGRFQALLEDSLRGRFERNARDEQAYMRGVDIIQAGQPEHVRQHAAVHMAVVHYQDRPWATRGTSGRVAVYI